MIWISLAVMICVIIFSAASLRGWRGDALGIPVIAIGSFTFLYVIQPLQLLWTSTNSLFLTDWQMSEGLLVPALMLACFMWGWMFPARSTQTARVPWNRQALRRFGFGTACIGLILYVAFIELSGGFAESYSVAHGGGMDWMKNTAYLYDGPMLMLSGSCIMIFAYPITRTDQWMIYTPYGFLALFLANAVMGGDRGGLFNVISVALVSNAIARRWNVQIRQAFVVLLVAGCLITVVFVNRDRIHLGQHNPQEAASTSEALNGLVGTSESDQEHDTTAQEFLFSAVQLSTVDQARKLDYGLNWIEFLVINPIPRLLWPEKSLPPSGGVTWDDIKEHTSLSIAKGSACGIVADIYARFGLASVFFFFGLGFVLRRLLIAAYNPNRIGTAVGYVMVYATSLNMFAQGFTTNFVFLGYTMTPVFLFCWLTNKSRRKIGENQRGLTASQTEVEQWKVATLQGERWS